MIISLQIRAARAMLKWSAEQLANQAAVSLRTVKRLELLDGPLNARVQTIEAIQTALESAGIEFIGSPGNQPGVRLK
jgi:hypothetical protein